LYALFIVVIVFMIMLALLLIFYLYLLTINFIDCDIVVAGSMSFIIYLHFSIRIIRKWIQYELNDYLILIFNIIS
jgi:hypothetical protein